MPGRNKDVFIATTWRANLFSFAMILYVHLRRHNYTHGRLSYCSWATQWRLQFSIATNLLELFVEGAFIGVNIYILRVHPYSFSVDTHSHLYRFNNTIASSKFLLPFFPLVLFCEEIVQIAGLSHAGEDEVT